jgi:uracil-DNA glycosylase
MEKLLVDPSWKRVLQAEFEQEYFKNLSRFATAEYAAQTICPKYEEIFHAFNVCPLDRVKVVILGQDPYHGAGQAHGLSFSVADAAPIPPSLKNIFKELQVDMGNAAPESGNLEGWATQGVLLLNVTLTVRAGEAGSHQGKGWEQFTDAAISTLSGQREHIVFILWGNYAHKKGVLIDRNKHLVLESAHPSPLSAHHGFFGSKPFSRANEYLIKNEIKPIDW